MVCVLAFFWGEVCDSLTYVSGLDVIMQFRLALNSDCFESSQTYCDILSQQINTLKDKMEILVINEYLIWDEVEGPRKIPGEHDAFTASIGNAVTIW